MRNTTDITQPNYVGPGSPMFRLEYMLDKLRDRFPGAISMFSSASPELAYLSEIDKLIQFRERTEQLLNELYGPTACGKTEPQMIECDEEVVTLSSALAAISHVGAYNGRGREQEAQGMLESVPTKLPDLGDVHADLADTIREHLTAAYACTRVWEAWQVGTMSQDDFVQLNETEMADDLAQSIIDNFTVRQS